MSERRLQRNFGSRVSESYFNRDEQLPAQTALALSVLDEQRNRHGAKHDCSMSVLWSRRDEQ